MTPRDFSRKLFHCPWSTRICSLEYWSPGGEFFSSVHPGQARPCWQNQLLPSAKQPSSTFQPRLWFQSGGGRARSSSESFSNWPGSISRARYSLMRSTASWVRGVGLAQNTKAVEEWRHNCSFKWTALSRKSKMSSFWPPAICPGI